MSTAIFDLPDGSQEWVPVDGARFDELVVSGYTYVLAPGSVLVPEPADGAVYRYNTVTDKWEPSTAAQLADTDVEGLINDPASATSGALTATIGQGVGALAPEPSGGDDTAALKPLLLLAKKINLRPGKTYVISEAFALTAGQVLDGQGATLKRANQASSAVSTTITSGTTTTVTVADGSKFRVGMQVTLATGAAATTTAFSSPRNVSAVAGNQVTVSSPFDLTAAAGAATLYVTHSLVVAPGGCVIRNLNTDGNRANVPFARWQNTTEVTISGDSNLVEGGYWKDCPGEGMVWFGNHSRALGVRMENVNGNGVHFSGATNNVASRLWIKSANLDPNVGHADGAFSLSNNVYDTVVSECYLDTAISGVGGYDSPDNARLKVLGCTIKNMTLTTLDGRLPNGVGVDDLTFADNTVADCANAEFGSTGAATTVRGKRWKIHRNTFIRTNVELNRLEDSEFLGNTVEADSDLEVLVQVNGLINCKVDDNIAVGGTYGFYFAGEVCTGVSVSRNQCRGQRDSGIQSQWIGAGSSGVTVKSNIVTGTAAAAAGWRGIFVGTKVDAESNTVTGPPAGGHSCIWSTNGGIVRGNLCRKGGATYTIRTDGGSTGVLMLNNFVDTAISNGGGAGNTEAGTVLVAA